MEMKLIRESIQLEQPLGMGSALAVVEGEATLPGGLREEARVLAAEAMASVQGTETSADRVNVSGRVLFRVLYTQGDPSRVNALEASADFMQPCSVPGAQSRASSQAAAQVQRTEARVVGGRLHMRSEVALTVRASSPSPVDSLVAVEGMDEVEVRTQEVHICRTASQGTGEALLREELELPEGMEIRETLFAAAWPVLTEVTGGIGRVGLVGQVLLEAVHSCDEPGKPLVITRHSIPFTQSVEITGEEGESLSGQVTVKDVAAASQEDGSGGQLLRAEVLLGLSGRCDREETLSLMTDAFTTRGDDLQLTGRTLRVRTGAEHVTAAESGRMTLLLPESAPPVRTVLAAFVTPVMTGREQAAGRMTITGDMDTTLLYMTDGSSAPVSVRLTEPFRVSTSGMLGEDALMTLAVTEAEARPVTSDRVEVRYILHLNGDSMPSQPVTFTTDAQAVPAPAPTEDMVLCFVQPGESLWDIARRYRLPETRIRALNPGQTGELHPGQGLVVWRGQGG